MSKKDKQKEFIGKRVVKFYATDDIPKTLKKSYFYNFIGDVKENLKNEQESHNNEPAVPRGITKKEFSRFYNIKTFNALVYLSTPIFLLYLSVSYTVPFITYLMYVVITAICMVFYLKNAYSQWRCRIVAKNWSQRHRSLITSYNAFLKAASKEWSILLPLTLEFEKVKQ